MDEIQIKKELEQLENSELISIVKSEDEENCLRLQAAWGILQERGIMDKILTEMENDMQKQNLSMEDLLNASGEDNKKSDDFSNRVKQNIGKEIFINNRDILGVIKNPNAFEEASFNKNISVEERKNLMRKAQIKFIISGISFAIALLLFASNLVFIGKTLIEWTLVGHCFFNMFKAFTMYRIEKNENLKS